MASYDDVLRYLSGLDYPAGKADVLREAEREGAPPDVLKALRALPPVDYANGNEVARSAGIEAAPRSARRSARRRPGTGTRGCRSTCAASER
ncbi:DUF2795 domain-containing protein [Micromonospora olivasterospora]|uniref:Uncharacterized protein DUF2795 n=1 Tax=Micromonospora olivasterospora TaxID=1880 RepID=A0A562IET1_MICOL|nr:DUF2795 domain-containing protein [Micromonospora olivasterospora]TWH69529.1 uncharacterized protein DUF2795 [Micromonospora olivasterospora]